MDDEIRAEVDGPLDIRAGKGVVHDQANPARVGDLGGAAKIGEAHHRVGRGLDEQQLGVRTDRLLDLLRLGRVDVAELELIAGQHPVEEPERAAVGVVGDDHVIARLQQGRDRADGRHT